MSAKKKTPEKRFTPALIGYRTQSGVRLFAVKPGAAPWKTDLGKKPESRDDLDWLGHIPGAGVEEWKQEIQRIESHDILPPLAPELERMKAAPRVRAREEEWAKAAAALDAARAQGKEGDIDKAWEQERECENAHHKERTEAQSLAMDYVLALLRIEKMLRIVATSPDTEDLTRRAIVRKLRPFYERIWTARETKTAGKNAGEDRKLYLDFMKLPDWEEAGERNLPEGEEAGAKKLPEGEQAVEKVGKCRGKKTKDAHPEIARWTVAEMDRVHEDAGRHRRLKYDTDEDGEVIKREGLPGPDMEKFSGFAAFWTGYLREWLRSRWEKNRAALASEKGKENALKKRAVQEKLNPGDRWKFTPLAEWKPVPITRLRKPFDRGFEDIEKPAKDRKGPKPAKDRKGPIPPKDGKGPIHNAAEQYYFKEMQQFQDDPECAPTVKLLRKRILEGLNAPPPKARRKKAGAGGNA